MKDNLTSETKIATPTVAGNYTSICMVCNRHMEFADKRCRLCTDCVKPAEAPVTSNEEIPPGLMTAAHKARPFVRVWLMGKHGSSFGGWTVEQMEDAAAMIAEAVKEAFDQLRPASETVEFHVHEFGPQPEGMTSPSGKPFSYCRCGATAPALKSSAVETPSDERSAAREDISYYNGARQAAAMAHQSLDAMDKWVSAGCGNRYPQARVVLKGSTVETAGSADVRSTLDDIYRSLCAAWDNRTLPASVLSADQFTRMREALDIPFPGYCNPGSPPEAKSTQPPDSRGDAALWVLAWLAMKGGLGSEVHEVIEAVVEGRAAMRPNNKLHIEPRGAVNEETKHG